MQNIDARDTWDDGPTIEIPYEAVWAGLEITPPVRLGQWWKKSAAVIRRICRQSDITTTAELPAFQMEVR
jgi:hypothetical protein